MTEEILLLLLFDLHCSYVLRGRELRPLGPLRDSSTTLGETITPVL